MVLSYNLGVNVQVPYTPAINKNGFPSVPYVMTLRSWGQGTCAVWLLAIPVWKLSLSEASRPFAVEIIISCALAQIGIARTVLPTPDRWQGAQTLHMLLCSLGRHGHASWLGTCYCNRGCLWSSQRHCPGRAGSDRTGLLQSEHIPSWPMLGANQALGCWEISLLTSLGIFIIPLIRGDHNEVQCRFLKSLFLLLGILPQ